MFWKIILLFFTFSNSSFAEEACRDNTSPQNNSTFQEITYSVSTNSNVSDAQLKRIQQLTTAFENSTVDFQYDYIENIHDGRGYTAGRVGFCSGTSDMLDVVETYEKLHPNNALSPFLPELKRLDKLGLPRSGVTKGLVGLPAAWKLAAKDPLFMKAQDEEVQKTYLQPALDHAKELGLKTALSQGMIYDTIIQHGDGDDLDGLKALIKKTTLEMHGTPASGVDEKQWITEFMKIRRADLAHANNVASRKEWAKSVDRVDCYQRIMDTGNWNLEGPIHFTVYGDAFTAP